MGVRVPQGPRDAPAQRGRRDRETGPEIHVTNTASWKVRHWRAKRSRKAWRPWALGVRLPHLPRRRDGRRDCSSLTHETVATSAGPAGVVSNPAEARRNRRAAPRRSERHTAPVAQWSERPPVERRAAGSSPVGSAKEGPTGGNPSAPSTATLQRHTPCIPERHQHFEGSGLPDNLRMPVDEDAEQATAGPLDKDEPTPP